MAGQEVGVAYYSLLPSGKGFGKAVEKELDDAADGHDKAQRSLWSKVTKYGAIAAATIGALFTATVLKGGLSRALNIEDAQAKLKGLGHDTESVTEIMQNALAAVKGTAFGLDSAATIAASAVAAGIKPGEQLERYLRLTADAATIAGASLDEMGSILNKVQGSGKAYNDSLQQLADRGIPIYQWLAEELGTTTDAVFKLASEGKISSEQFQTAIEKNIAGAALASGDTTRGAFANMQAAMSRWGANLLTGVLPFAKKFFDEMIVIFDGLNARSSPFIKKFNAWLSGINIEGFGERFLGWLDNLDLSTLTDTLAALKPVLDVINQVRPLVWSTLAGALAQIGEALTPKLPEIAGALSAAIVRIAPKLPELVDSLTPLIPVLADLLVELVPAAEALLMWGTNLVEMTAKNEGYTASWGDLLLSLMGLGGLAKIFDAAFAAMGSSPAKFFDQIGSTFALGWNGVVDATVAFGLRLGETIAGIWDAVGKTIGYNLKIITGFFTGNNDLIQQGLDGLRARFGGVWESITGSAAVAGTLIVTTVGRMWAGVQTGFNTGIAFLQSIPERIVGFFDTLPAQMASIGRQMIQGLIDGITGMAANATRSMANLSSSLVSTMKSWLGIRSPSRVFYGIGEDVVAGLTNAFADNQVSTDLAVQQLVSIPSIDTGTGGGGSTTTLNFEGVDPFLVWQVAKRELGARLAVI